MGSPWSALITGGLVTRLLTSFVGEGYPFPAPQPLVAETILAGTVSVQNWSMLTMSLRLLAGAMGVPFMPTRSLLGSSMEEDNARDGDFLAADDPFVGVDGPTAGAAASPTATRIGFVRALVPDVALCHAWAADRAGNVLAAAPLNENFYAAMAARRGAIVTVEKIVTTDFIRRHAGFVRLPAQYVAAVVEAPLGAHPAGMYGMNLPELEGYAEDPEFILELRRAFRQLETARGWIREWMLEVPDQAGYLAKLGYERIMEVKGRAHTDAWVSELEMLEGSLGPDECQSDSERMVVAAARLLCARGRRDPCPAPEPLRGQGPLRDRAGPACDDGRLGPRRLRKSRRPRRAGPERRLRRSARGGRRAAGTRGVRVGAQSRAGAQALRAADARGAPARPPLRSAPLLPGGARVIELP